MSETVQKAFWENLSTIPNTEQIILVENKEPPDSIKDKIHFVLFTGDDLVGRKGFYPKT